MKWRNIAGKTVARADASSTRENPRVDTGDNPRFPSGCAIIGRDGRRRGERQMSALLGNRSALLGNYNFRISQVPGYLPPIAFGSSGLTVAAVTLPAAWPTAGGGIEWLLLGFAGICLTVKGTV